MQFWFCLAALAAAAHAQVIAPYGPTDAPFIPTVPPNGPPFGPAVAPNVGPFGQTYRPRAPSAYNNQYYDPALGAAVPILTYSNNQNVDGSYEFSFSTADGKQVQESGFLKDAFVNNAGEPEGVQVVQGSYSYTAPDGTPIQVTYTADENGFRPQGVHIPADGKAPTLAPGAGVVSARYDPYNSRYKQLNRYNQYDPYSQNDRYPYNQYDRTRYNPRSSFNQYDPYNRYNTRYNPVNGYGAPLVAAAPTRPDTADKSN